MASSMEKAGLFSRICIKEHVPLKGFSSFRIGGVGRYLAIVNELEQLKACLEFCSCIGLRPIVLGGGTNTLFADGLLNYVFLKLGKQFCYIREGEKSVVVGSSVSMVKLVRLLGYKLSVFSGLPGTVGGAVMGNSGVKVADKHIGFLDICQTVTILNPLGEIEVLNGSDIAKGYRRSNIDGIILEVEIRPDVLEDLWGVIPQRPMVEEFPNIGCIFKNPSQSVSAGALIEALGFKGKTVGGAMVSNRHANFILNVDNAVFSDVMSLIDEIRDAAFSEGVELELEIRVVK